jgi:hypothetical protein
MYELDTEMLIPSEIILFICYVYQLQYLREEKNIIKPIPAVFDRTTQLQFLAGDHPSS